MYFLIRRIEGRVSGDNIYSKRRRNGLLQPKQHVHLEQIT